MRLTLTCMSDLINRSTTKLLDKYSQFHPSVLTIQNFIDFGTANKSAKKSFVFLRKELPVRFANIMKEINLLPEQLRCQPSVRQVNGWFEQNFIEILKFEKLDIQEDPSILKRFNATLNEMRIRNKSVVETMAQGVIEMKDNLSPIEYKILDPRVQYFLDRFYMSRISLRMLVQQHLQLYADHKTSAHHIGSIDPNCDVVTIAEDAYENARFLCEQYYNTAPTCSFICHPHTCAGDDKSSRVKITYVPSHLYHILFELFKNSVRAVVEFHQNRTESPPITCLICKGQEDVVIKISDQGGGICRSEMGKLFDYMYSTAPHPPSPDAQETTPLAGYGYGLPLSRLYAKYFNGDLCLSSVDGFGTDAYLYLKLIPSDATEILPVFSKTSTLVYSASPRVGDWSEDKSPRR